MARCNNCGCNDADVDWGLCYECFCREDDTSGGALSSVAAMGYERMGMPEAAASCRSAAQRKAAIKTISETLDQHPELIGKVMQLIENQYESPELINNK